MSGGKGFGSFLSTWAALRGKPATFPPAAHSHPWGEVTGKPNTFPPAAHSHAFADITDKPSAYPPSAHGHTIADVQGLQTALDAQAAKNNVLLGTVNIAETGLTLLALSVRRVTINVTGAVVGGNYNVYPVNAVPAGFGIVDAVCTTAGQITFGMLVPLITGNYSIPVRVVRVVT